MIYEWKDLEGNGLGLIDIVSRHLPGVAEESHEQLHLEYPFEIQTEHLPSAVLQTPRYQVYP
jgi:hypothetical protein